MKEITIKIDFGTIADYISEDELVRMAKSAIEDKINNYYPHDINELIKSYLIQVMTKHTDNVFMNTPCMEDKIRQQVLKCIDSLSTFEVFREKEQTYWTNRGDSVAQTILNTYCNTDEFKEKLTAKIDSVMADKLEQASLDDFIYMMADGMADTIRKALIKKGNK